MKSQIKKKKTRANGKFISIILAPFFSLVTIGIVNVTLPNLVIAFDENFELVQWISLSYLIILPIFIPIMSKLGEIVGYTRIHNLGILIFTASSILLIFSPSIFWMILFRAIQGIGAAMFQATNIAIITIMYPVEKRGKILGWLSTSVALGSIIGPIIGGVLINWFSWEIVFSIHVPFLVLVTYVSFKFLKIKELKHDKKIDVFGALQVSIAIACLLFIITMINVLGWNSPIIILVSLTLMICLATVVYHTKYADQPFLNMRLLSSKSVILGILISFGTYVASFAIQVSIPFHLQTVLNYSPVLTGILMTFYPLMLAFTSPFFGAKSDILGSRKLILPGLTLMIIALISMITVGDSIYFFWIVIMLSLLGMGMGMITSPNYSMVMKSVEPKLVGMAGGFIALSRTIGTAVGSACGLLIVDIWIPEDMGEIPKILSVRNIDSIEFALMGFNILYIVMALLIFFLLMLVWKFGKSTSNRIKEKSS